MWAKLAFNVLDRRSENEGSEEQVHMERAALHFHRVLQYLYSELLLFLLFF